MRNVKEVTWKEIQKVLNGATAEIFIYDKRIVPFDFDASWVETEDPGSVLAYIDDSTFKWSTIHLDNDNASAPRFFMFTDSSVPGKEFICVYGNFYTCDTSGSVPVNRRSPLSHLFFSYSNEGVESV